MGLDFGIDIIFKNKRTGEEYEPFELCYARKCYTLRDRVRNLQSYFWDERFKEKECKSDYEITCGCTILRPLVVDLTTALLEIDGEDSVWNETLLIVIYSEWIKKLSLFYYMVEQREKENLDLEEDDAVFDSIEWVKIDRENFVDLWYDFDNEILIRSYNSY